MVNECFTRASNMHSILKIEKGNFFFSRCRVYGTQCSHVVGKLSTTRLGSLVLFLIIYIKMWVSLCGPDWLLTPHPVSASLIQGKDYRHIQ